MHTANVIMLSKYRRTIVVTSSYRRSLIIFLQGRLNLHGTEVVGAAPLRGTQSRGPPASSSFLPKNYSD